jgi:Tfp pilus assembly protein PilN
MMKINLLGQPTRAARAAAAPTTVARQVTILVVSLVVCFSVVGLLYYYWGRQVENERAQLAKEQTRQKELAGVKAQNALYQRQLAQLQERINTIQKLQTARTGPVDLMTGLGDTVNRTKDLYLLTVEPRGNTLDIRGVSMSVQAIADFITALNRSDSFENVELQRYFQDNQENRTRFRFELSATYKPPAPPQPPSATGAAQPAKPAAGRPGR